MCGVVPNASTDSKYDVVSMIIDWTESFVKDDCIRLPVFILDTGKKKNWTPCPNEI